jgi:hypothetical protein
MLTKNNNNVLIIGGGNLSNYLCRYGEQNSINITVVQLRDILRWTTDVNNINKFGRVIYIGYDHFSIAKNIYILFLFIIYINKQKYKGILLFYNTQGSILRRITKNSSLIDGLLSFDRYVLAKKAQSLILKMGKCSRINVFLPIVYGANGNFENFMHSIAKSKNVEFPGCGDSYFYFLDIDKLSNFSFNNCNSIVECRYSEYLLYSEYETIINFFFKNYCNNCLTKLVATRYSNRLNMSYIFNIKFFVKSILRNIVSMLRYLLPGSNYKDMQIKVHSKEESIKKLTPGSNNFYSLKFKSPCKLKNVKSIKV